MKFLKWIFEILSEGISLRIYGIISEEIYGEISQRNLGRF